MFGNWIKSVRAAIESRVAHLSGFYYWNPVGGMHVAFRENDTRPDVLSWFDFGTAYEGSKQFYVWIGRVEIMLFPPDSEYGYLEIERGTFHFLLDFRDWQKEVRENCERMAEELEATKEERASVRKARVKRA